jgi:hypothetical protein
MYDHREHERKRIARLKALAAELERLPKSRARDRLLREVLHRSVSIDTGVPAMSCWGDGPDPEGFALFEDMALHGRARFASQRG